MSKFFWLPGDALSAITQVESNLKGLSVEAYGYVCLDVLGLAPTLPKIKNKKLKGVCD